MLQSFGANDFHLYRVYFCARHHARVFPRVRGRMLRLRLRTLSPGYPDRAETPAYQPILEDHVEIRDTSLLSLFLRHFRLSGRAEGRRTVRQLFDAALARHVLRLARLLGVDVDSLDCLLSSMSAFDRVHFRLF